MTSTIQEKVLWLDVTMGNTHTVQVLHTMQDLLEATFDLSDAHPALLDCSVEVSTRTVFHDLTPSLLLILHEIDGFDDVCVMQG